jgi:Uma2 family endonuclease
MATVLETPELTLDELLQLDDGVERWTIQGDLWEKPMTYRNRWHSKLEAWITHLLLEWLMLRPLPRGQVHSGEAGCRLRRDPNTVVGIDIVYISAELAAHDPDDTTIIDGVPILAVEILSPSDKEEEINAKIDEFMDVGVKQAWVVDPHDETVTVYRPGQPPETFNITRELSGEPDLPGFRVAVARIFHRD